MTRGCLTISPPLILPPFKPLHFCIDFNYKDPQCGRQPKLGDADIPWDNSHYWVFELTRLKG